MKKILWATFALFAFAYSAHAQTTDYSLSQSGWVSGGNTGSAQPSTYGSNGTGVTTVTGSKTINCCGPYTWVISPYTGSTMVGLQPGAPTASYSNMTSALGLSATSISGLSSEIAAQNPSGGGNITNAAWISKDFTFSSPTSFSMYWVYTSTDYVPFNDGSITSFVNINSATTLAKINNVAKQYLLLGATNPGTGNYSTGSYGSTGWQIVNYEVVTAGTYKLGFAAFNQGDTALSPVLFVNDGLGTVTKNGQPFNSVSPNDPNMPAPPSNNPPAAPTVVSTAPTNPVVSSSTTYGATTTANLVTVSSTNTGTSFNLNKTTTPVTSTPYTITTTTTPKVIQTWSDNTTTTINDPNNPATTSTQTGTAYQFGSTSSQIQNASSAALKNAIAYNNFNPFIVDALSIKDGQWAEPVSKFARINGGLRTGGFSFGYQKTIDNNTFGTAGGFQTTEGYGYLNSKVTADSSYGTAYWLTKQNYAWIKSSIGYSNTAYNSSVNIPSFNLLNSNKVDQKNMYADITVYSSKDIAGFRPLFGMTVNNSNISSTQEYGSPLLSTLPEKKSKTEVRPYAGVRYQVDDNFSVEVRATRSNDFKTVGQARIRYDKKITEYTSVYVSAGGDYGGNGYKGLSVMAGLTVKF